MTTPDEATLWAREKRAEIALLDNNTAEAERHRSGGCDAWPFTLAIAEAHRAGHAAAQAEAEARVKALEAAIRPLLEAADKPAAPFKGTPRELMERSSVELGLALLEALPAIRAALGDA